MAMELERQQASPVSKVERTRNCPVIAPPVDIHETNEQIVIVADMPGVTEGGIDVTLEQDVLTIVGRVGKEERPGYELALSEFGEGDYRRVFTLATAVERDTISAEVKDGVLRIVLPKAEPAKAKRIAVKVQ